VPDEVIAMGSFSQGLELRLSLNRVRVVPANRVDSLAGVSVDVAGVVGVPATNPAGTVIGHVEIV
jgi:hypothetical protein